MLVPTFHPAAVLRGGAQQMAQMRADLVRAKQALVGPPSAEGGATEPVSPAPEPAEPREPPEPDARLFD